MLPYKREYFIVDELTLISREFFLIMKFVHSKQKFVKRWWIMNQIQTRTEKNKHIVQERTWSDMSVHQRACGCLHSFWSVTMLPDSSLRKSWEFPELPFSKILRFFFDNMGIVLQKWQNKYDGVHYVIRSVLCSIHLVKIFIF